MEKLGLNLGFLIVQILNFGILFVILRAWVYKPIMAMLEKRKFTITQGMEDAKVAAAARENAEREAEKIIAEAQSQANKIVSEASTRAESAVREIKASQDAEISKQREARMAEIESERNKLLGELRGKVATLAIAAAQKLVKVSMNDSHQRALVEEFFSGIKSGKVVVLEGEKLTGASVEVISALPLSSQEQTVVKKDLALQLGETAEVQFKVDQSILGGLIVKAGGQVLDNSFASQLERMRQAMH